MALLRTEGVTLSFPNPGGSVQDAVWDGECFRVDGRTERVLAYTGGSSGWTDELTSFHEKVAGDSHFIDAASRRFAIRALSDMRERPLIMDVGCSTGFFVEALRAARPDARVMAADYVRGPLEALARRTRGIPLLQFDLTRCPLPDDWLDAAVLLNVLEHIEDDFAALQQVRRILKPGGRAVIELPAGPHLYDIYDKQLMHFRRYRMKELCELIERAGLRVRERTHLGFILYPGFWFTKRRNQRLLNAPDEVQRAVVAGDIQSTRGNLVLKAAVGVEQWLRPLVRYPVGIRCQVVAEKSR